MNNYDQIKLNENIIIMGADKTEWEQMGKINLEIELNGFWYELDAYIIKGLSCKLLLGNDFHINNKLIINFDKRKLTLNNNNVIKMDEVWYDYYKIINNLTMSNFVMITSLIILQIEEEIEGNVISSENIIIPPKSSS